jgi:hypothetical protein
LEGKLAWESDWRTARHFRAMSHLAPPQVPAISISLLLPIYPKHDGCD